MEEDVRVLVPEKQAKKRGKALVEEVLRPEVRKFSEVFRRTSGSALTKMEREVLTFYLYHKITTAKE